MRLPPRVGEMPLATRRGVVELQRTECLDTLTSFLHLLYVAASLNCTSDTKISMLGSNTGEVGAVGQYHVDDAAYRAGRQVVIASNVDFEAELLALARAYIVSRMLDGSEEALEVLRSFLRGAHVAREERGAQALPDQQASA